VVAYERGRRQESTTVAETVHIDESSWRVEEGPRDEEVRLLREHLGSYNIRHSTIEEGIDLAIFLRDIGGALVGGITGWLWGGCLEIDYLWVHEDLRGRGIGQRLVHTLETVALQRGCRQSTLNTFSFQAPAFYQRLGYEVFGVIDGYGHAHQKLYLRKRLA